MRCVCRYALHCTCQTQMLWMETCSHTRQHAHITAAFAALYPLCMLHHALSAGPSDNAFGADASTSHNGMTCRHFCQAHRTALMLCRHKGTEMEAHERLIKQ